MSHLPSKQALCSHPLGQSWPLTQPISPSLSRAQGGSGEVENGVWHGGIPIPATTGTQLHTAPGSLARREMGGMALEMPCPCCWGVPGPRGGRSLLPCQQHLQNGVPAEETQPNSKRGVPSCKAAPLSSNPPQGRRKPPV